MSLQGYVIAAVVLLLLIGVSSCSSITIVETGHRGVETRFGKVEGDPLPEGIYFTSPFTTSIHPVDIRTQKYEGKTDVYTKDVQTATVSYAVNVSVQPSAVGDLYRTVGLDYEDKLIPQAVQGTLKNATGKWEAVEIIAHREEVRKEVETALSALLAPRGLVIEGFQLQDVAFTDAFDKAVESKVVAIQTAEQAQNRTVQVTEEAKQRVISADADAKAMQIKSAALSQNQNLVSYEAVQKWDGHLPDYMMGNSVPFISLPAQGK